MRLQYDDEFDLDVRFTFSGASSMAVGGEPGRALPATAQGQTCGHRHTCHTCETKCQEASCDRTCRTCDTQCDQAETCGDTCPHTQCATCGNTCAGNTCVQTCPATQCATCGNTCQGATCPATQC